MSLRRRLFVISALVLAACSEAVAPNPAGIELAIDRPVYVAGESVSTQLINKSNESIGIGACDLRLERFSGGSWELVGPQSVLCIGIMYVIGAGGMREAILPLDAALPAGRYRLRQTIYPQTQLPTELVRSGPFQIQALSRTQ